MNEKLWFLGNFIALMIGIIIFFETDSFGYGFIGTYITSVLVDIRYEVEK